jgi:hypothetical protein
VCSRADDPTQYDVAPGAYSRSEISRAEARDRSPSPEDFDKFTDEQFYAYVDGIGFADRIRAALAEATAERSQLADLRAAVEAALNDWESRRVGVIPGGPTARLVADLRFALRLAPSQPVLTPEEK